MVQIETHIFSLHIFLNKFGSVKIIFYVI